MSQPSRATLEPRKTPVQARSTASVDAILDATVQVLLKLGKEQLTTTRVAARAGVSVGTLYQYFPNKSALLRAVLTRHLGAVTEHVEAVCRQQSGKPLQQMGTALVTAFFEAKMRDVKTSVALYAVSDDVDGARILQQMNIRSNKAVAAMLATAREQLTGDPLVIALILQGALGGISRRLLESSSPDKELDSMRREVIVLACAYLDACSAPVTD